MASENNRKDQAAGNVERQSSSADPDRKTKHAKGPKTTTRAARPKATNSFRPGTHGLVLRPIAYDDTREDGVREAPSQGGAAVARVDRSALISDVYAGKLHPRIAAGLAPQFLLFPAVPLKMVSAVSVPTGFLRMLDIG